GGAGAGAGRVGLLHGHHLDSAVPPGPAALRAALRAAGPWPARGPAGSDLVTQLSGARHYLAPTIARANSRYCQTTASSVSGPSSRNHTATPIPRSRMA